MTYVVDQGVHALIYDAFSKIETEAVDPQLLAALQRESHREAGRSLRQEAEIRTLDAALLEAGMRCLALKGTSLAYNAYPYPALRPRSDTDLLFREAEITEARRVLIDLGYQCPPPVTPLRKSVYLTTQITCTRQRFGTWRNEVDVHWRMSNSLLFADVFSFEDLNRTATSRRMPTQAVVAPSAAHCLWIALCHRFLDPNRDRLIWLYDIHLLVEKLRDAELCDMVETAIERRLASVLLEGLCAARRTFGTEFDPALLHRLATGRLIGSEPAERLRNASSVLGRRSVEFRSLNNWRKRLEFLHIALFPPRSYLQLQGSCSENAPLPWLYVKRAFKRASPPRNVRRPY